jgi:SAM-dependent methyltransferase
LSTNLNEDYWDNRWKELQTQWDIGFAAPALMDYMQQISNKDLSILIPGCGNAYEAEALAALGFTNITLIDISEKLVKSLQEKYKNNASIKVVLGDYFEHETQYDIILEQTFFCAINPALRQQYANHTAKLLNKNGILTGVLFNREFEQAGPPFGGSVEEYKTYFGTLFDIIKMEPCYNSIAPRAGSEVFIKFVKK